MILKVCWEGQGRVGRQVLANLFIDRTCNKTPTVPQDVCSKYLVGHFGILFLIV